jgi:hypothetical protein
MVESTRQVQSEDPYDRFEQAIADPRLYETTHQTYEFRFAETPEADLLHHDPVPLFLPTMRTRAIIQLPNMLSDAAREGSPAHYVS